MVIKYSIPAIIFLTLFVLTSGTFAFAGTEIRIAEYNFRPIGYVEQGVARGILPDYTNELRKKVPKDVVITDCVVNLARGLQKMLDATSYDMAFMAPMMEHSDQLEDLGIAYPIRYLALPLKGIEIKGIDDLLKYDVGVLRLTRGKGRCGVFSTVCDDPRRDAENNPIVLFKDYKQGMKMMLYDTPRFQVIMISDLGAYYSLNNTGLFAKVNYPGWTFKTAGIHLYLSKKSPIYRDRVLVNTIKNGVKSLFRYNVGTRIVDHHLGSDQWRK